MVIMSGTPFQLQSFITETQLDAVLCPEHVKVILGILQSTGAGCSYSGCLDGVANPDWNDAVKQGWRRVLVGRKFLRPDQILGAEIDGLLCPRHFVQVMRQFKVGASRGY